MRFAVGRSDAGDDLFILQMKKSAVAPTMLVLQAVTNALQCHPGSGQLCLYGARSLQFFVIFGF